MKTEQYLPLLKHPELDERAEFIIRDGFLTDKKSEKKYPIIKKMIDFQASVKTDDSDVKKGLMFKLNTVFSKYLDFMIQTSFFAGGGVGFINVRKKTKQWIDLVTKDKTLFLEPDDKRLLSYIGPEKCLTVEDLASRNVMPMAEDYPNLNASHEQLPIRSSSFQNLISFFVVEHVKNPRRHFSEIERILKPGGYVILSGPGDVYPSHRVPYNYFNIIRYGYHEMFKENNLELVEEYFPAKSWVSILYLCYSTLVRNSCYNKNQFTKLLQMIIFGISLIISPFFNLAAIFLDMIMPFDKRIYSLYMALLKKPDVRDPKKEE